MPNINLDEDVRRRIAVSLCQEISAFDDARKPQLQTWNDHEHMYQADNVASEIEIVEGLGGYAIPLWKPQLDRIVAHVQRSIFRQSPTVQCIDVSGQESRNIEPLERTLDNLADKAGLQAAFGKATRNSGNTNLGTVCLRLETDKKGEISGLKAHSIPAQRAIGFPAEVECYADAKTAGYLKYMMLWEVKRAQAQKTFYEAITSPGTNPNKTLPGGDENALGVTSDNSSLNEWVKLAVCYTQMDLAAFKEGKSEQEIDGTGYAWYVATVDVDAETLLSLEPNGMSDDRGKYEEYDHIPLVEVKLQPQEEDGLVSKYSVAYAMKQIQDLYSALFTTQTQGSQMNAFAPTAIIGPLNGMDYKNISPGQVVTLPEGCKVQSLAIPFDGKNIVTLLEMLQGVSDSVIGFGRLGTGEALPSGTTATEVDALSQAMEEAKDQYTEAVSSSVARLYELLYMYLKAHYNDLKRVYGSAIEVTQEELDSFQLRMEVTGKSGTSNPSLTLKKLQVAMNMKLQFPQCAIDENKLVMEIVDALNLPFESDKIMLSPAIQMVMAAGATEQEAKAADAMAKMQQQGVMPPNGQPQDPGSVPGPVLGADSAPIGDAQGGEIGGPGQSIGGGGPIPNPPGGNPGY